MGLSAWRDISKRGTVIHPRPGPFAIEAFSYDIRRMPTWQILTADPPYALVCRTTVAGREADVVIDTLLSGHFVPALATNYRAFAYVQIGQDSVLRIAASISTTQRRPASSCGRCPICVKTPSLGNGDRSQPGPVPKSDVNVT